MKRQWSGSDTVGLRDARKYRNYRPLSLSMTCWRDCFKTRFEQLVSRITKLSILFKSRRSVCLLYEVLRSASNTISALNLWIVTMWELSNVLLQEEMFLFFSFFFIEILKKICLTPLFWFFLYPIILLCAFWSASLHSFLWFSYMCYRLLPMVGTKNTRKLWCKASNMLLKSFSYEYCFTREVLRNNRPMGHTCSLE